MCQHIYQCNCYLNKSYLQCPNSNPFFPEILFSEYIKENKIQKKRTYAYRCHRKKEPIQMLLHKGENNHTAKRGIFFP